MRGLCNGFDFVTRVVLKGKCVRNHAGWGTWWGHANCDAWWVPCIWGTPWGVKINGPRGGNRAERFWLWEFSLLGHVVGHTWWVLSRMGTCDGSCVTDKGLRYWGGEGVPESLGS